jgi:hypothetical protein
MNCTAEDFRQAAEGILNMPWPRFAASNLLHQAADRIAKLEAELRVRDRALEEACKTRPLLLCNTPGAGDCRHQTAEFYMQIAREALAREQEAENAD